MGHNIGTREKIYSWVKNNIGIKVGCVILAILLWFYVTSSLSIMRNFTVAITWKNLPPNLVVSEVDTNSISVRAEGERRVLLKIQDSDFYLGLDLSKFEKPGNYAFDLSSDMIKAPSGAKVIQFSPERVMVTLSKKTSPPKEKK